MKDEQFIEFLDPQPRREPVRLVVTRACARPGEPDTFLRYATPLDLAEALQTLPRTVGYDLWSVCECVVCHHHIAAHDPQGVCAISKCDCRRGRTLKT